MIFKSKKKQKLDPKVRFQNRQFNQKLDKARQFKRTPRAIPETRIDQWLSKIYLGSRWSQIGVGLIVPALLYVLYVPNFLTIESISVSGLPESESRVAEGAIRQAIAAAPFYNPQHNLLLVSKHRISGAVLLVPSVFEVQNITKDFKQRTLQVIAVPKFDQFIISDVSKTYTVYNDGILHNGQDGTINFLDPGATSLIRIKVNGKVERSDSHLFVNDQFKNNVVEIESALQKNIPNSKLAYFEIGGTEFNIVSGKDFSKSTFQTPLVLDEIRLVLLKNNDTTKPFTVILDARSNVEDAINRLAALLIQTPTDRYNAIDYIDLRIQNRGYICLLKTPCSK